MPLGISLGSRLGSFDGSSLGNFVGRPEVGDGEPPVPVLLRSGDFLSGEPSCREVAMSTTTATAAIAASATSTTKSGLRRLPGPGGRSGPSGGRGPGGQSS
ncbi:hypothetical protein FBY22_5246 [Streptomyces sp. SLBN-31]|jgi:hypothetical protein|nr:hypothetical protein FBY22_5246 [Streptomyces sp. SLBN-31]